MLDTQWLAHVGVSKLMIVADGPLHALPFSALVDPTVGHYLAEDWSVELLLSARALTTPERSPRAGQQRSLRVLAVGPAADAQRPPLAEVSSEIAELTRHYSSSESLTAQRATPSAVRSIADQFDVIHFAGHAHADLAFPWSSYLALSPDASHPSGLLQASDIESWRLPGTRLVVLGACETAVGTVFRGEGVASLARPFLRAGTRSVVGSLWKVEDRSTRSLLVTFHQAFVGDQDAGAALHAAQLSHLRSADPSDQLAKTWASFVVIVGSRQ